MKKYFFVMATILLFIKGVYSQTNVLDGVYIKSDEEQIVTIDKMVQEIKTNLNSYTKSKAFKDSISSSDFFLQDNELKLVIVKTNDENIEKRVSWYFADGRLIFSEQVWIDNKTNALIDHEEFYQGMGRLLAWIKTDKTKEDPSSKDFKYVKEGLLAQAERLIDESKK